MPDKKPKLIIIDDDPVVEAYFKEALDEIGMEYEYFSDSEFGFERLKENGAVVCIMDYIMPKYTGEELAIKFSEELLFQKGDIYLYTSKEFNDSDRFKMLTLGFKEIIKKPMSKDKLLELLEEHQILPEKKIAA